MKWYEKFKVGQKVRVVRKVDSWNYGGRTDWVENMNQTIGKTYKIAEIDKYIGYRLCTQLKTGFSSFYNYWYPLKSLACVKGEQLLFSFME